jgi:hypothetical protein
VIEQKNSGTGIEEGVLAGTLIPCSTIVPRLDLEYKLRVFRRVVFSLVNVPAQLP